MKIPTRILAPILVALACAALLVAVLWWELYRSTEWLIERTSPTDGLTGGSGSFLAPLLPAIDPRDRALLELRHGDIAALRGDWAQAQSHYEASVKNGGGIPALRKLAQAQLQRRDYEHVAETIQDLESAGAAPEDVLLLRSLVELRSGDRAVARTALEAAADSPHKSYGLSLLAIVEGNHEIAQQELNNVLQGWEPVLRTHARMLLDAYAEYARFPKSPETHLVILLARALAQVQQCELALPLLHSVTVQESDYRDAWIVKGYCELTSDRAAEALLSLERAYNLDPQKPETQYFLGRAYQAAADPINALTFFEYALANGFEPEGEIRQEIARTALQLDNQTLALEQYEALLAVPEPSLSAYEGFVKTSLLLDDAASAYLKAQEAALRYPREAGAFVLLGRAAYESDREVEARAAVQTALELDPLNEEAQDLKREID